MSGRSPHLPRTGDAEAPVPSCAKLGAMICVCQKLLVRLGYVIKHYNSILPLRTSLLSLATLSLTFPELCSINSTIGSSWSAWVLARQSQASQQLKYSPGTLHPEEQFLTATDTKTDSLHSDHPVQFSQDLINSLQASSEVRDRLFPRGQSTKQNRPTPPAQNLWNFTYNKE